MWRVLGAIAVLSAPGLWPAAQASPPAPAATGDPASRGLYVALRVCAACHKLGAPGAGPDSAAPSFAVIRQRHDAVGLRRLLRQISRVGHQEMPPIPMSRREIEDVAAYIGSVSAAPVSARPPIEDSQDPAAARPTTLPVTHSAH